jgi:hypothetical protein
VAQLNAMKTDRYYQFPISALSYGMPHDDRWEHVLFFACLDYGRKAIQKTPHFIIGPDVRAYKHRQKIPSQPNETPDQMAILFALTRFALNVPSREPQYFVDLATQVEKHCAAHPYPMVRIRADFWWKTFGNNKGGTPISFREFCVICAVYALVGDKAYTKASLDRIRRLAAGIPDRAAFEHAIKQPEESRHSLILSTRQARTTLDHLELNRFFAKFTYNRGECFYSNRLDRVELADMVAKRKLSKKETIAIHRELDRGASLEIKERIENSSVVWMNAA